MKKTFSISQKISLSGMLIALYISIMFISQSFAFGQYQIRIATSLYALAGIYPFFIIPLGIANFMSNLLFGGLGVLDIFGGLFVGLLTAYGCFSLRKIHVILVAMPILIIPSVFVSMWLSYLLNIPFILLLISIGIGQIIPSIVGVLLVILIEKKIIKGTSND